MRKLDRVELKYFITLIVSLVIFGQVNFIYGQTDKSTTEDEIARLKSEKEKAELRKAIAEAEAAELKARFPEPKTTPLEGKTTIDDGVVIETQIRAYRAMEDVAKEISGEISSFNTIAIYDPKEKANILGLRTTKEQLKLITDQYCQIFKTGSVGVCPHAITASALPALPIISSLLGQFVDLTGFLRTNVEIKGKSFIIDEPAIAAEVFSFVKVNNANANLYYPAMFPPNIDGYTRSDFLAALNKAINTKSGAESLLMNIEVAEKNVNEAKAAVSKIKIALAEAQLKRQETLVYLSRLERIYNKKVPLEKQEVIQELRDRLTRLGTEEAELKTKLAEAGAELKKHENVRDAAQANFDNMLIDSALSAQAATKLKLINQQLEQYISNLIQVDKTSGTNALTSYIKAEQLEKLMEDGGHWLQVKVLQAGGNNRIKTNLLWDIFTGGNRLSHSGGVVVEYILFDKNGKTVKSGTIGKYLKYRKSSNVARQ